MIAESSDPFGFDHKIFEILLKEQEYTAKETSFSCQFNQLHLFLYNVRTFLEIYHLQ